MKIKIRKVNKDVRTPMYVHPNDAGFDLAAAEDVVIYPGCTVLVPTGLAFEIPEGYELQIRARSGLSAKTSLRVANGIGTVDAGFSGEVKVLIWNSWPYRTNGVAHKINKGDRIAQGVICPVIKAEFEEVEELGDSSRGDKGFGSSGVGND